MSIANEIQRLQTAKADIKVAIEEKGVTVGDGTIDTYATKIGEISGDSGDYKQGYEDGKNSVVDLARYIIHRPQFTSLNIFGTSETVLNLDSIHENGDLLNMFNISTAENANTIVEHLTINCPTQISSIQQILFCSNNESYDRTLKRLTFNIDTQKCTNFNYAFSGLVALETVDGMPLNFSANAQATLNLFTNDRALKDFRVVKETIYKNFNIQHCSLLSTDTIQSIIDGLADLTGGTAQTLTLHATVGAKLTDTQKATITAKNWTLVY